MAYFPADTPEIGSAQHFMQIPLHRLSEVGMQTRFADSSEAVCVVVDVGEGEALYFPPFWLHQVTSFGEHMAINYWWY